MKREEYTDAVLRELRHVTEREKKELRRELDGHMEDHMLALVELGYDEAAAEEKAAAAMGDPAETGRELQKCYSFGWLIAERVLAVVLALLFMACILNSYSVGHGIVDIVKTHLSPMSFVEESSRKGTQKLDIRVDCGGSEVKFFGIRLTEPDQAEIFACIYSKRLFGYAANINIGYYEPGTDAFLSLRGGDDHGGDYYKYRSRIVELPEGVDHIDAVIEWLGAERRVEIPIDWEAAV